MIIESLINFTKEKKKTWGSVRFVLSQYNYNNFTIVAFTRYQPKSFLFSRKSILNTRIKKKTPRRLFYIQLLDSIKHYAGISRTEALRIASFNAS